MANMTNPSTEPLARTRGPAQEFGAKIDSAEKNLEKMSHEAGAKIGAMATNVVDTTKEYVENSREYVKENPGKSVAMAAAAGVVAGSLITWVMGKKH